MKKIILVLLVFSSFVFANVGKITAIKGEVFVLRDSKQIKAKSAFILKIKDRIVTGKKSKAKVLFKDNTSITIGKNSTMSVQEFVMDLKSPKKSKTKFGFGKGVFRTITGKIGKINPNGFKIKTKSASIGIRGTIFQVAVSPKNLVVDVESGATWVLPAGQNVPVDVPEGKVLVFDDEKKTIQVMPKAKFEEEKTKENKKEEKEEKVKEKEESEQKENESEKKETDSKKEDKNNTPDKKPEEKPSASPKETPDNGPEGPGGEPNLPPEDPNPPVIPLPPEPKEPEEPPVLEPPVSEPSTNTDSEESTPDTINVETLLPNSQLDDLTNVSKQSVCNDNSCDHFTSFLDYGYLKNGDEIVGAYINGALTNAALVENYINNTGGSAIYNGGLIAFADGADSALSGEITLDMDFTKQTFTGNLSIGNNDWAAKINNDNTDVNTITSQGFSSTNFTNNGGQNTVNSGSIDGKYYGPNLEAAGGVIILNGGEVKATFGAKK